jgi:outer membrane murein-binding lipoprotein Lpp
MQMFYRTPSETIEAANQRIEGLTRDYLSNLEHVNDRARIILGSTLDTLEADLETGLNGVRNSVETLNASLQGAVHGVDSFRLDPSQLQAAMDDLRGTVHGSVTLLQAGLDELAKVGRSFATAADTVERATAQAEGQVGKATATLAGRVDAFGQSVEDLSRRIAAAGLDPRKAQEGLDNLAASIAASSSRVTEQLRVLAESTAAVAGGVGSATSRLNGLRLSELEQSARSFSASIESFASTIRESGNALDTGALKTLRESLGNTAGQAQRMNAVLDEIVEAVRVKLAQIR